MEPSVEALQQQSILQVCRLTPLWGVDLFKQITLAYKMHRVTTVFLSGSPDPSLTDQYHGKVIFLEIDHKKPLWRFKAAIKLWLICRKEKFDKVICHHYKPTVIMDWVRNFISAKSYFSVHHTRGNLRRASRRLYTRFFLRRHWKFIAISKWVKNDLKNAGAGLSEQQFKIIYNAIMLDEVQQKQLPRCDARKKLGLRSEHFVFGTIGRLVYSKGHVDLIQAFSKIHQDCPDAVLIILGIGPLEALLNEYIEKLELRHKVFINTIEAKQASHFVQAFDSFVFPSAQEGFGLVLLEAMSAQLPIVASNCGGIPEVMGTTGITVPLVGDNLSQALLKVYRLSHHERIEMGILGYQRLCSYFLQPHFEAAWNGL